MSSSALAANQVRDPAAALLALTLLVALFLLLRPLAASLLRKARLRIVEDALRRRRCSNQSATGAAVEAEAGQVGVSFDPRRRDVPPDLLWYLLEAAAEAARDGGPPDDGLPASERLSCTSFVVTSDRDRLEELAQIYDADASGYLLSSSASSAAAVMAARSARVVRSASVVVTCAADLDPLQRWCELSGASASKAAAAAVSTVASAMAVSLPNALASTSSASAVVAGFEADLGNLASYQSASAEALRAAENFASLCAVAGFEGTYLSQPSIHLPPSSTTSYPSSSLSPSDMVHNFLGLPPRLSAAVAFYAVGWPASPHGGGCGGGIRFGFVMPSSPLDAFARCRRLCHRGAASGPVADDEDREHLRRDRCIGTSQQPVRIHVDSYETMTAVEVLEHHATLEHGWREREGQKWRNLQRWSRTRRATAAASAVAAGTSLRFGGERRQSSSATGRRRFGGRSSGTSGENGFSDDYPNADVESHGGGGVDSAAAAATAAAAAATPPQHNDDDDDDRKFEAFLTSHSIDGAARYLSAAGGIAGRDLRRRSRRRLDLLQRRGFMNNGDKGFMNNERGRGCDWGGQEAEQEDDDDDVPCRACGQRSHVEDLPPRRLQREEQTTVLAACSGECKACEARSPLAFSAADCYMYSYQYDCDEETTTVGDGGRSDVASLPSTVPSNSNGGGGGAQHHYYIDSPSDLSAAAAVNRQLQQRQQLPPVGRPTSLTRRPLPPDSIAEIEEEHQQRKHSLAA